jgi:hypothetical protein
VSFDQANEIIDRAHRLLAQKQAREVQAAKEAAAAPAQAAPDEDASEAEAEAGHGVSVSEEGAEGAAHDAAQVESGAATEAAPEAGLETEAAPQETSEETPDETIDPARLAEPEPTSEEAADELDQEWQYAPPPDAEPEPSRPDASAVPNFDAMSPSEVQIQEALADAPPGSEEALGMMPASGLEAFAPGAQVIPETHREWAEKSGIEESQEQTAEELIESFRDDLTLEDVKNVTGETEAGDESGEKKE